MNVEELGSIMKKCREKAELSQDDMALLLNRSRSCISKYENNHKLPDLFTFIDWFNVTDSKEVAIEFIRRFEFISN